MRQTGERQEKVVVAISGSPHSQRLIDAGKHLADLLGAPWDVIFIETPETAARSGTTATAAEALGLAAKLGATIATVPAARVVDGIDAHLESERATHLVLGRRGRSLRMRIWSRSLIDQLAARHAGLALHILPTTAPAAPAPQPVLTPQPGISAKDFGYAALLVAATLVVAELLQLFISTRSLDLLFLFPVIAVAARLGLAPAVFAVVLSVLCYNFFLLSPAFTFTPGAPQNVVMTGVLSVIAIYTAIITQRMRGRALLSDRSARENASIAAFGQRLTRAADWEGSAVTVCEHVHKLVGVSTVMFREVSGELVQTAALPAALSLTPVDRAALEAAWSSGVAAGAGTESVSAADWQFQPLKTSLGVLAVLGIARDDGRDPIRADQRVLLSTLLAQAALAHERLRLEDRMRQAASA